MTKEIISIDDVNKRKERIDSLLQQMNINKERNGFFGKEDVVEINGIGNGFLLDDVNIYYMFFDKLRLIYETNQDDLQEVSGCLISCAIKNTIQDYFGNGDDRTKRQSLTHFEITDNDELITPSISKLKKQNCALCTEKASIAHNLWLLNGIESYYIKSLETNFPSSSSEYKMMGTLLRLLITIIHINCMI